MRRVLCIMLMLACAEVGRTQGNPVLQTFQYWSTLQTPVEKMIFMQGFTNGFFAGPRSARFLMLANCIETKIDTAQSIAMVDKFYRDHPEKWNLPIGSGIVSALTIADGPCAGKNPWS